MMLKVFLIKLPTNIIHTCLSDYGGNLVTEVYPSMLHKHNSVILNSCQYTKSSHDNRKNWEIRLMSGELHYSQVLTVQKN